MNCKKCIILLCCFACLILWLLIGLVSLGSGNHGDSSNANCCGIFPSDEQVAELKILK